MRFVHGPHAAPAPAPEKKPRPSPSPSPLDAGALLWLQRTAGNRAATIAVQRIEESHAWVAGMREGNRALVMAQNNAETGDWLTKIGDLFVKGGFTMHDSKGKRMAFLKRGTMEDAQNDLKGFGVTLTKAARDATHTHTQEKVPIYFDLSKGVTLRPFSASSKETVAAIDFKVGACTFEFKYTQPAAT